MKNSAKAMKRAHEIRTNTAKVHNCDISEIDFTTCLKLAWKEIKAEGRKTRVSTKTKIMNLIRGGYNTVEAMAERLEISRKNISSNLTYLRRELALDGLTLTSDRHDSQTIINLVTA